jgi:endonuclease-3 related protein
VSAMDLEELRDRLLAGRDMTGWWPAETPFEVMVGAVLTQQTTWENVTKAIAALRQEGLLDVQVLADCLPGQLMPLVRCTGFYRQKSMRLISMARHAVEGHGDIEAMLDQGTDRLRNELLGLPGIGPETADSILLFAAGRPRFVAAAYVSRVLSRTGVLASDDYDQVQAFVEGSIAPDVAAYQELYAVLVDHARTICLKGPRCVRCKMADQCRFALTPGRIRCCPPQRR